MRTLVLVLFASLSTCTTFPVTPDASPDAPSDVSLSTDAPPVNTFPDGFTDASAVDTPSDVSVVDTLPDASPSDAVAPYLPCASPTAPCADRTQCVSPLAFITGPAPRYVCSRPCAIASDCPGYTPDGGITCLGTAIQAPQCVRLCAGDIDCVSYGLNCYATHLPDASAMVEFCVP